MRHALWLSVPVLAAALAAAAFAQQQPQPRYGCLASGNCGQKGSTTNAGPRDYWQNWICAGCHSGPVNAYAPSPAERALLAVPARFWVMHADAEHGGETRARIAQHRLKPLSRIGPTFRRLLAARPAEN